MTMSTLGASSLKSTIQGTATPHATSAGAAQTTRQCIRLPTPSRPVGTPWGTAQHHREMADGIVFFSTAGHGGFCLSLARFEAMPQALRGCGFLESGLRWFEEDVDWCAVALAFPEFFSPRDLQSADDTLRHWRPDLWESFHGATLEDEQSETRRRDAFYRRHRLDLLEMTIWRDTTPGVPPGKVAIRAVRGGPGGSNEPASFWLVDAEEYEATRCFAFVIDPARHLHWEPEFIVGGR